MSDYEPVDLTPWCATPADAIPGRPISLGPGLLRGFPFLIGSLEKDALVALRAGDQPLTIPIGIHSHRVLVAHRLSSTDLPQGGALGLLVATYEFNVGGRVFAVPIREGFELGVVPSPPGLSPFLAWGDHHDELPPRFAGPWEKSGERRKEVVAGGARTFHLWMWENPDPGTRIESVSLVPRGGAFVVGGLTLGHRDENPFVHAGNSEIHVLFAREPQAPPEIRIDRGTASYPYPLTQRSVQEFLDDPLRGWGEAPNPSWTRIWAEIAAVPSATISVWSEGHELSSISWEALERSGSVAAPGCSVGSANRGRNWVHITVVDADTREPIPCRVHFRSPEGIPYQPHGHQRYVDSGLPPWHLDVGGDLRLGGITYAYIDGTCQGWLPRGDVLVEVARGFEYEPLRQIVNIAPGQRELTIVLQRWIDMNAHGWFSGDSHVHFLSAQGAHFEAQGEDLDVVNLLASQWGNWFTSTEEFTGEANASSDGDSIVYVSQENRQHRLGHLNLWGLRAPVMPWCSDGPNEAEMGGILDATPSHWADECREQGGTVIVAHFPYPNGEVAALVATGRADGIEMAEHDAYSHVEYYRYLNCGYRMPLVGGTDKMSSDVAVGQCRTYARLPEGQPLTYDAWCGAVRAGRTFLSSGPIIGFSADGASIGDTITLPGPGSVTVHAWAESIFPIHTLQIVQEGRVVAATDDANGARRLELDVSIPVDQHSWLAVRCGGPGYHSMLLHHDEWRRGIFAHSSPIYVACGGEWRMHDATGAQHLLTLVEGSLAYTRGVAPRRPEGSVSYRHGELDHQAWLERPLLEAIELLRARLAEGDARKSPHPD